MSLTHPYAVVKFINEVDSEEEVVSEVPSNWVVDNGQYCWWPPNKNVTSLVAKSAYPNTATWQKHKIHLEMYCKSLDYARRKAGDLQYVSTDDAEMGKGKARKRKNKQKFSESSDSEDAQGSCILNKLPVFPVSPASIQSDANIHEPQTEENEGVCEDVEIIHVEKLPQYDTVIGGKIDDLQEYIDGKFKLLFAQLAEIKLTMAGFHSEPAIEMQDKLLNNIEKHIPVTSLEKLLEFDYALQQNNELEKELVLYIQRTGGNSCKELIWRSLKRIFTDEVAKNCSWLGQRNNQKICNLKIIDTLRSSVNLRFKNFVDKEFEEIVAEWFRQGKQRYQREKKKTADVQHI